MSTRCQLAVYKDESDPINRPADGVFIYRHSDGYPDGVVPDILEFLKSFNDRRGIGDTSYCVARLVQHLTNNYDGMLQGMAQEQSKKDGPVTTTYAGILGHGVDTVIHGDIEYFYHISPTALKVFKVAHDDGTFHKLPASQWAMIERHDLKNPAPSTI